MGKKGLWVLSTLLEEEIPIEILTADYVGKPRERGEKSTVIQIGPLVRRLLCCYSSFNSAYDSAGGLRHKISKSPLLERYLSSLESGIPDRLSLEFTNLYSRHSPDVVDNSRGVSNRISPIKVENTVRQHRGNKT